MQLSEVLSIRAGSAALARLRSHGLDPAEVALIPAAAGGPKGLVLTPLDQVIFGEWLARAPRRRWLIGASIGAWRMAAACLPRPVEALKRLARLYSEAQNYRKNPSPAEISATCADIIEQLLDGEASALLDNREYRLAVLTVRGRGVLAREHRATPIAWALAAAANTADRRHLARFLERAVFAADTRDLPFFDSRLDSFANRVSPLTLDNLPRALLASASIPLLMQGVNELPGSPRGTYWDGGIIDYHLALPYSRIDGLVLYPHFADHITPGWLDKHLPRRRARGAELANVIMLSPSSEFVARLPGGKLPDRSDFKRFGTDHAARIKLWRSAISESERLAEAFLRWCEAPDLARVRSFAAP